MAKTYYDGDHDYQHGEIPAVGVLLVNLGTPAAPTAAGLRPYLRQFLGDRRVIELPRLLWWLILNLFVLTMRPRKSAALYREIWTEEGSPLLVTSRRLARAIGEGLRARMGTPLHVALGMTYGEPSVAAAMTELRAKGCRRLLVLPLYPHYSATSTAASLDAVMKVLMTWRWVPELRTVHTYHDDPGHIEALASSVREVWDKEGEPEKLLLSFHGIPRSYFLNGDPYHCLCHKTARLVAERLNLSRERYEVAFQSLFGREEWLKPYTDVTLQAMAEAGIRRVDVLCPGFSIDCLETLEEIDQQNRKIFLDAGGEVFRYIPALNDRPDQVAMLVGLINRNLAGWVASHEEWDEEAARAAGEASRRRADALRACPRRADAGYGAGD